MQKLISALGTITRGHSLQQFNTHDHFGHLIYFSGESHILKNEAYLACGLIGYTSGNTTSLYLDKIFSALTFSTEPLVK